MFTCFRIDMLCILDITIEGKRFRLIRAHTPRERAETFKISSKLVVLDWNSVFEVKKLLQFPRI